MITSELPTASPFPVDAAAFSHALESLIPAAWKTIFSEIFWDFDAHGGIDPHIRGLVNFLAEQYAAAHEGSEIYPPQADIFRAFAETPPEQVRVVLLGQDPYHEPGQAQGLSFSVPNGTRLPPSLRNIFKERESDLGIPAQNAAPCLLPWAQQGVLLLNTTLTVRRGAAGSHRRHGWEIFTDRLLQRLDACDTPMVFLLWGADARKKAALLRNPTHLILESEHPSPLSAWRGFFGSRPFSQINAYLTEHGLSPIDWTT